VNGLYSNLQQKKLYYNTPERYINGFWVSVLGILGLKIIKPGNAPLTQLLNRNYTMLLYSTDAFHDDTLPDYLIACKVIRELGIVSGGQTQNIFKFFDKCRANSFRSISQNELRRVLKLLPIYKLRPNAFIADSVYDFLAGKVDLEFIANRLFIFNEQEKLSEMMTRYGGLLRNDLLKHAQGVS
jgi:hypothetical protein